MQRFLLIFFVFLSLSSKLVFAEDNSNELLCNEIVEEDSRFLLICDESNSLQKSEDLADVMSHIQVWDRFNQTFLSYFDYLKIGAYQIFDQWNTEIKPPMQARKTFDKIGKMVFGDWTYHLFGSHVEETEIDSYGEREVHDKVRVTFINGILNTRRMVLHSLEMISDSHGGVNVHYVFRPTEGWVWDISRAIMIKAAFKLGFRSLHAHLLAQIWRELIEEMGGTQGGGVIIHYAHSLGASDTDRARDLLTPEEQKMIRVVTFGPATLIPNIGFQRVENHISVNDGVSSFLLEPIGHIRNYFDPNTNVHCYGEMSKPPYWPTDHFLNGPTYGPLIFRLGEEFIKEYIN